MSEELRKGWRRYRRLPTVGQVAIAIVVIGLYTAGMAFAVVSLTGSSDKVKIVREPAPVHKASPLERKIRKIIAGAGTVQFESGDIKQFRAPEVGPIRCKATSCKVTYYLAVPGGGRILEQQAYMIRAIMPPLGIGRLDLYVVRGIPTGPYASQAKEEETAQGVPLMQTACSWNGGPNATRDPFAFMAQACTSVRPGGQFNAALNHTPGASPVQLPKSAPEYQPGNPRYSLKGKTSLGK